MAANVEERIVDMQFNNKQFEDGIKTTQKSLADFEQSLQKIGGKGAFDGLTSAVDSVRDRFSVLEGAASVALGNMASQAMMAGAQIIKAFTIDPIVSGFREYETGLTAVQTILTNTQANAASTSKATSDSIASSAEEAVDAVGSVGTASTTAIRRGHEDAMEALRESRDAAVEGLREQHDAEDEEMEKHQEGQMESLETFWEEQLEVREDTYDKELESLEKSIDAERELLDENHEQNLQMYEDEYMAKLKTIDEGRYAEIKAIDDEIEKLKSLTEADQEAARLRQESAKLAALQNKINNAEDAEERRKAEDELAEYKKKLADEAVKRERDAQIESLKEDKEAVKEKFDVQEEEAKQYYEDAKDLEKQNYEDLKDIAAENAEEDKKLLKETYEEEKELMEETRDFEVEKMDEAHETETKNREDTQKTALKNLQDEYAEKEKSLKRAQEDELESLKTVQTAAVKNVEDLVTKKKGMSLQDVLGIDLNKAPELADVNAKLDELNEYADKTIYNFGEMTRNMGTFTAAGIDLDTSGIAIKGISNLAAASGSTSQQASTAMYQISQALSAGTVTLQDWNSIVNAGMGGKMFQNELAETAKQHGISVDDMIEKEGSFRLTLQNGWLSSDILIETLAKFTGELTDEQLKLMGYTDAEIVRIQEMAKNAENAATQVKTFTQLTDTLKEAVGSGWAQTFEILLGDFNEATELWTGINDKLGTFIKSVGDERNAMLEAWSQMGGRDDLLGPDGALFKGLEGIQNLLGPVYQAFKDVFSLDAGEFKGLTQTIQDIATGFADFTAKLNGNNGLYNAAKGVFDLFGLAGDIFGTLFEIVGRVAGLFAGDLLVGVVDLAGGLGSAISGFRDMVKEGDYLGTFADVVVGIFEKIKTAVETAVTWITGSEGWNNAVEFLKQTGTKISEGLKAGWEALTTYDYGAALTTTWDAIKKVYETILPIIQPIVTKVGELGTEFADKFKEIGDKVKALLDETVFSASNFTGVDTYSIGNTVQKIVDAFDPISTIEGGLMTAWESIVAAFNWAKEKLQIVWNYLKPIIDPMITEVKTWFANLTSEDVNALLTGGLIASIILAVEKLKNIFEPAKGILESISGVFDNVGGVLQAYQNNLNADALLKIGGAVALLAAGIIALGMVPEANLSTAMTTMTTLFLELGGMFTLLSKLSVTGGGAAGIGAGFMEIAAAMLIFAGVIQLFGSMDMEKVFMGITILTVLLTELGLFVVAVGGAEHMVGVGFGLNEIAVAMGLMIPILLGLAAIPIDTLNKGLTYMGILLAELATFVKVSGGATEMVAIGFGLNEIAIAMALMMPSMIAMGNMDTEVLKQGLLALGAFLLELAGFAKIAGGAKNMISIGLGLDALAFGIGIMVDILIRLSESINDKTAEAFVIMTGILVDTIAAVKILGKENFKSILTTIEALVLIMGSLEALTWLLGQIAATLPPNTAETLLIMGGIILECWAAVKLLSNINFKQMLKTMTNMALFIGGFGVIIAAFGALDALDGTNDFMQKGIEIFNSLGDVLLVLLGFMAEAWLAVKAFGNVDPKLMLKAIEDVAIFIGGFAALITVFGVIDSLDGTNDFMQKGTEIFEGLGGVLLELLGFMAEAWLAVKAFGNVDPKKMVKAIEDIAIFIGGFAVLITAFGAIDALDGSHDIMQKGIEIFEGLGGVLLELLAFMGEAWLAVKAFGNVDPAKMIKAMEDVAIFIGGFAVLITAFGAIDVLDGTHDLIQNGTELFAGLEEVLVTLLEMMGAAWVTVKAFGNIDPAKMAKAMADLAIFIGGFEAIIVAFGLIDALDGTADVQQKGIEMFNKLGEVLPIMFGCMGAAWVAAKALGNIDPATMGQALLILAEFIGGLELILVALGAINELTGGGFVDLLNSAGEVLQATGEAIGNFVGGIVGGMAASTMDILGPQLVQFGQELAQFAEGVKPLFEVFSTLTPQMAAGAAIMGAALIEITAASVINGVTSWFSGGNISLAQFGQELAAFAEPFNTFASSISTIDVNTANGVKALAETLLIITAADIISGLTSWFTGGSMDLQGFGQELAAFAEPFRTFADSITGIDGGVVESAAYAAKAMAEVYNFLPKENGVVQYWVGTTIPLSRFAEEMAMMGPAIKTFADAVSGGIDEASVTAAANAAKIVAGIYDELPEENGVLQYWVGTTMSLSAFAEELGAFGPGIVAFSNAVKGNVDEGAVTAAANAGKAVASIYDELPEENGVLQYWVGTTMSLSAFAEELAAFGPAIVEYSNAIKAGQIDADAVAKSGYAAKAVAGVYDVLPEDNGVLQYWVGTTMSLTKFAEELASFGPAIVEYSNTVKSGNIDTDAVEKSVSAAEIVAAFSNTLPVQGEWTEFFTGKKMSLTEFATELTTFGESLVAYSSIITGDGGINSEAVAASGRACQVLADVANTLPEYGGAWAEWFGEKSLVVFGEELAAFAPHIKKYSDIITANGGIDEGAVAASGRAVQTLAEFANLVPESGGLWSLLAGETDLAEFGTSMVSFGTSLKSYYDSIANIQTGKIDEVVKSMMGLVDLAMTLSYTPMNGMNSFSEALKKQAEAGITEFLAQFTDADVKAKDAITKFITSIVNAFTDNNNTLTKIGEDAAKTVASAISTQNDAMYKAGENLIKQFNNAIKAEAFEGKSTMYDALSAIVDEASKDSWYTRMESSGKYMLSGLVAGLREKLSDVKAISREIVQAVDEAIRAEALINSPSKMTMILGEYLGEGLGVGLLSTEGSLVKDATGLTDSLLGALDGSNLMNADSAAMMTNGLGSAIQKIMDEINGGIDITPTISPIVDMTDASNRLKGFFGSDYGLNLDSVAVRASNLTAQTQQQTQKTETKTTEPQQVIYEITMHNVVRDDYDIQRINKDMFVQVQLAEAKKGRTAQIRTRR